MSPRASATRVDRDRMTMKPELAALINTALEQLVSQGVLAGLPDAAPQIDRQKDQSLGDLS